MITRLTATALLVFTLICALVVVGAAPAKSNLERAQTRQSATLQLAVAGQSETIDPYLDAHGINAGVQEVTLSASVTIKKTPIRTLAYDWARKERGKPYVWGGTGPRGFDCSGLIYEAYLKAAHVNIGRDTYDMLANRHLKRVTHPHTGDLAFFGTGHVELYVSGTLYHGKTFGAHHSGTTISERSYNSYYHPSAFYEIV